MRKIRIWKTVVSLVMSTVLLFSATAVYSQETMTDNQDMEASGSLLPTAENNLRIYLRSSSKLVATDDGFMRVYFDGEQINIEYYDDDFTVQSKKSIDMELDIWGGFYAGSDAYYLVEGQNNIAESDTAEVIRVIQYDKDWNKKGTAKIAGNPELGGSEVRLPFNYGCVEMTEYNGILYIVTGHEGYVDSYYGRGHQGFLMLAVDEASMTGSIVSGDEWHSFAQYITCKDSDLYVLEQSEGSRCTKLSKYNTENIQQTSLPVLKYGGERTSSRAITCYASVDGMALSSDHVLCLGTSIDQSQYDNVSSDMAHNIYLTVTPMADFSEDATTVKWLTNYQGGGKCFLGTKITKVNDNYFMISWEEFPGEEMDENQLIDMDDSGSASILHYIFVDGNGNKVSREFTAAAPISDCQPIVKDSKIIYYASSANMVNFYSIDAETGNFSKKTYQVAGENATWTLKEGVLTVSGTGPMFVDTEPHPRRPISATADYGFSYFAHDVWKPIRENVKKIVISKGITSISANAFNQLQNLTEVTIEPGVKSIGKEAFCSCHALSKITIPSSVTDIGEDFLWSGYFADEYDDTHLVWATIYAPGNSYAEKYADENNIRFKDISEEPVTPPVETPVVPSTEAPVTPPSVKAGDVDHDGNVNLSDAQLVLKAALKIKGVPEADKTLYDVSNDGLVSLLDAYIVLKAALHIIKL